MKNVFTVLILLLSICSIAQNVDYISNVDGFYGNCPEIGREEYSWKGWLCDDVDLTEDYSGCITKDGNGPTSYATRCLTRTRTNIASTKIISRFDGWEDDRGSRYTFDSDNNPRTNDDDCRVQKLSYFDILDANEYSSQSKSYSCGTPSMNMRISFSYQYSTTDLNTATSSNEVFTTGGDLPFWGAQGAWGNSNENTAASGSIENNQSSSFSTTVSCKTELNFNWRASSEAGHDFLEVYVNGNSVRQISGDTSWQPVTISLDRGTNIIEWKYTKDGAVSHNLDRGFVDDISFNDNEQIYAGSIDGAQSTCGASVPNALGTVNYTSSLYVGLNQQWQQMISGSWVDLTNETSESLSFTAPLLTTTTYRKKVSDTCGNTSYSNEIVVNVGQEDVADFTLAKSTFYPEDIIASPLKGTDTNLNGVFNGTNGLSIDSQTGEIDVISSTLGAHQVTYTTYGACPKSKTVNVEIQKDFVYENGIWIPNAPTDVNNPSTKFHTIKIMEDMVYDRDIIAKNLIVEPQSVTVFNGDVTLYGVFNNAGNVTFKSSVAAINVRSTITWTSNKTAVETLAVENSDLILNGNYLIYDSVYNDDAISVSTIDATNASVIFKADSSKAAVIDGAYLDIVGAVNVESHMTNRRSFRFLTSSVTTTTSIYENWQENGDDFAVGLGTQITGAGGAANGFDVTASNNPSMFGWDNINQSWVAQASTNNQTDILTAGKPYRMLIRGDRQIDLTNNSTPSSETVLRTKGDLKNNNQIMLDIPQIQGSFMMIGNPYQSNLDLKSQLLDLKNGLSNDMTAVDPNFYYVWDELGSASGVYRTYDLTSQSFVGADVVGSKMIPGTILPGQAFFIAASGATNGNMIVNRTSNDVPAQVAAKNGNVNNSSLVVSLYKGIPSNGLVSVDGLMIRFNSGSNNSVDNNDAVKFNNIDENLSRQHTDGTLLSIESRDTPQDGEVLQLKTNNYRGTDYVLGINPTGLSDVQAILVDNYNGTRTILNSNTITNYIFQVDASLTQSIASDRFEIEFENSTLSIGEDIIQESGIKLYPNPSTGDYVTLDINSSKDAQVAIYNTLGQLVKSQASNGLSSMTIATNELPSGTYIVNVTIEGNVYTEKLIVK